MPGQYVRIGIDVDGVREWRAYSLTHGPRADGLISITVKAVPDGKVSNHLVHEARPGTLVQLEQAAGDFVLAEPPGKLLFVTAGSGITPVIGMLRNLFPVTDSGVVRLPRSRDLDIVVVHVAPTEAHSIFLDNLRDLDASGAIRLVDRYDDVHGDPRRGRPRRRWCPTWPSARRTPVARPACSTRSRPTTTRPG